MSNVVTLDKDKLNSFLKEKPIAVISFWAAWCGPCKMMSPVIDQFAAKYGDEFAIGKINVDEFPGIAVLYDVKNVPTMVIFKNAQEAGRISGYYKAEDLKSEIVKRIF